MQHVFIVGSKGIPGNYGGYETFVDKLTEYHQNEPNIRYHVACAVDNRKDVKDFKYHNAHCFTILRKKLVPRRQFFMIQMRLSIASAILKPRKSVNLLYMC